MILSRNILKRVSDSKYFCRTPTVVHKPVSDAAVEEDCTCGLVIEVFDNSDKVGGDVLLHACPQSCMPNPVEGLLKSMKTW